MRKIQTSTRILGLCLTFAANALIGAAAQASSPDLINEALNQNLRERDRVTGTYMENKEASRPDVGENDRSDDSRIPVVMDGELNSGNAKLQFADHSERIYREKHIQKHLDKEVKSVENDFNREVPTEVSSK